VVVPQATHQVRQQRDHDEHRAIGAQTTIAEVGEQRRARSRVLGCAFPNTEHVFLAVGIDAELSRGRLNRHLDFNRDRDYAVLPRG